MIQNQVINYLLSTKDTSFLSTLTEEYFGELKEEFNFIKTHFDTYGNIPDKETFLSKFEDFDIISFGDESKKCLYDNLIQDKDKRDLINSYTKMVELINADKVKDAVDYMRSSISQIGNHTTVKYINLLDASSRYNKYLDKCENKEKYFISTGFKELDALIGGWDAQEELAVIVARSNVGKSQLAIKCASASVQQGLRVGIYSGEMSNEKVGYRIDTMFEHLPNYDLTRGDLKSQVSYKKYVDSLPYKFKGELWCLTPVELGKQATVSDLRKFIEDKNLDILYVDQYSLLEDQHHALKENEKFANLSKDLKNLQVMIKKPIIAVSQQNRGSTEEESIIDLSHIAMSDRIGQDATTVLFLTCKDNILDIYVSKSRDAEKDKKLSYAISWNTGTFDYIPNREDENAHQSETDDEDSIDYSTSYMNSYSDGEGVMF